MKHAVHGGAGRSQVSDQGQKPTKVAVGRPDERRVSILGVDAPLAGFPYPATMRPLALPPLPEDCPRNPLLTAAAPRPSRADPGD